MKQKINYASKIYYLNVSPLQVPLPNFSHAIDPHRECEWLGQKGVTTRWNPELKFEVVLRDLMLPQVDN